MSRSKSRKKKRKPSTIKQSPCPSSFGSAGEVGQGDISNDDPLLLTIPAVCNLLSVSRSTLDRMAKTDVIPGRIKLGGQIRYHRPTLERFLLAQLLS
jgi:excisionase family DNA binding protein